MRTLELARETTRTEGAIAMVTGVGGTPTFATVGLSDAELDYAFTLAKTLGGRAISSEISKSDEDLKRIGSFADKHQLLVGYHGHAATKPEHWENAFSFAKFNGANVDIGHFVAGNNISPEAARCLCKDA